MIRGIGGRPSEPDITHDGTGLVLLLLSALVAAGFWFDLPGGFGNGLRMGVSTIFGALSYALPLFGLAAMWHTLRHPVTLGTGGRQVLGWACFFLGLLGVINIAHGLPRPDHPEVVRRRRDARLHLLKFVRGSVNEMGRFAAAPRHDGSRGVAGSGTAVN